LHSAQLQVLKQQVTEKLDWDQGSRHLELIITSNGKSKRWSAAFIRNTQSEIIGTV